MTRSTLLFLLLALVACSDVAAPDVSQIRVELHASRTELVPGDTVRLRVVAHNPSKSVISIRTNGCALAVRVRTRGGDTVFQDPHVCNDIGLLHELAPGDSIEKTIVFDGMTTWGPFLDEDGREPELALAPGRYEAIGFITTPLESPSEPVELSIRPLQR